MSAMVITKEAKKDSRDRRSHQFLARRVPRSSFSTTYTMINTSEMSRTFRSVLIVGIRSVNCIKKYLIGLRALTFQEGKVKGTA